MTKIGTRPVVVRTVFTLLLEPGVPLEPSLPTGLPLDEPRRPRLLSISERAPLVRRTGGCGES